jgi:putative toxin-antitoxin system antitoxin component (TIGR02293 family)
MSVTVTDDQKATRRAKALVRTAKPETSSKKVVIKVKSPAKFRDVFNASPEDRIKIIRRGMPATEAKRIVQVLGLEHKFFDQALGLKTATVNRKIALSEQLSSDESERLLGVAKLIGQVEAIIAESGDPNDFNASEWISRWLREPLPAFGGTAPIELLDTMEGQAMVAEALARIQSGAYA